MIELPPTLRSRQTPAGAHHLGVKALFYGPPKSGKSFALASFPHPIFAIACGENGIEMYLQPAAGDVSVLVDDHKSYTEALEFALAHPEVKSIVVDNINLGYEDWQQAWEEELGVEEIKGKHWRVVKTGWRYIHRKVMRSAKHFGCSAWPKGAKYVEEEAAPGVQGKLKLYEQDVPHVERMIPFAVDLTFKTEVELDKVFKPTSWYRITYVGGRRPISIPANELYPGKHWRFDGKKVGEDSPFVKVLQPIMEKWGNGAALYEGIADPVEGEREVGEADAVFQDAETTRLVRLITGFGGTLAAYKELWDREIAGPINDLDAVHQALVMEKHAAKKKELGK